MQTSRERTIRAIEGSGPDKVPMWINFDRDSYNKPIVENILKEFDYDMLTIGCADPNFKPIAPGYRWLGYKMETLGETMGEVVEPPLEDWDKFNDWKAALPDFSNPDCYLAAKQIRKEQPDKFLVGGLFKLMEELINLRGYANYMLDFYDEEERLSELIDVLYDIAYKMVDGYADAGMDAVFAWEDWGLQYSPMISYEMWDKFFHKKMKAFVDYIHSKSMKYCLHSCGHIVYLLDAFADMGIDVLQLDQQKNMGLKTLSKWKKIFCFACPTDIQYSVNMSAEEMEEHLTQLKEKLGHADGGYIFRVYPQPAAIHMTEEKLRRELTIANGLIYPDRM